MQTDEGPRVCFHTVVERGEGKEPLVAWFGGIPLKRKVEAKPVDRAPVLATTQGNELIHRLLAGSCELCGSARRLEVHHIRKLADRTSQGAERGPHGSRPWRSGDGRPSWSAVSAMRVRMPVGSQSFRSSSHWRAVCDQSRTSGVRREALRCIPDPIGRNLEECFWVT